MARQSHPLGSLNVMRGAALVAACVLTHMVAAPKAFALCTQNGTNQTCTNPAGTLLGRIDDTGFLTLTNLGTITGTYAITSRGSDITNAGLIASGQFGIVSLGNSFDTRVNNSGLITAGSWGIEGFRNVDVTNSGSIISDGVGITALDTLTLINSGTITGLSYGVTGAAGTVDNSGLIDGGLNFGIGLGGPATIRNTGTVTAGTAIYLGAGTGSVLTNSGSIIGTGGTAIDFSRSSNDTLNLLAGSRIIGRILLGANDTINVQTASSGSSLLTLTPNGGYTLNVTGRLPYVVNNGQIATLEPTAFGMADRTMMDFTSNVSSLIASRFGEFASASNSGANAFAASTSPVADGAEAAFGSIPALGYARERNVPTATAVDRASGITVWSKGFAGWRRQDGDGDMAASSSTAYGGALGIDKQVRPDLRLGLFVGAGNGRLNVESNAQTVKTDYVFGGVYGRLDRGASFIDAAMTVGHTADSSERSIANNLVPGGFETARASYDGWFVTPEVTYGVHGPLSGRYVLTPSLRLRYLAGFIDGFAEQGSGQNLTMQRRTVQDFEQRFEFALSRSDAERYRALKTTARLGLVGVERLGDTSINAALIGQNFSFAAPGSNVVAGGYAGVAIDYRLAASVNLFAGVEAKAMSDKSRTATVQGGVRVSF